MATDRRGGRLTPEQISRASFATSFRGFDPDQVRLLLSEIADELREQRDLEAALRSQIAAHEGVPEIPPAELDEAALTAVLGQETARVLTAAREAAAQMRAKAEESVAAVLREAHDEAMRVRSEADAVLSERTSAAEAAAAQVKATAEARIATEKAASDAATKRTLAAAEQVLTDARAAAERTHAAAVEGAAGELDKARGEGRALVLEAQLVRERVLKDLARRRKTARAQLEQLRAGRERLLEAYDLVRRTLGEATGELSIALTEAKLAADAAVRRVELEPEPTVEELEAEVEAARLVGLPIIEQHRSTPAFDPDFEPVKAEVRPPIPPIDALPDLPDHIPPPQPALEPIRPARKGRRKRGVPELPPTELQPMAPPDPVEGMRLIVDPGPDAEAETVEVVELVEVTESVAVVVDDEGELTDEEIAEIDEIDVDDLFARIRAARADEVEKAHEILEGDAGSGEDAPDVHPEPGPANEPVDDDEAILERRDAMIDDLEQRATRKLKRVLADEQSEVLDRLRRTRGATLDALYPGGLDGQLARWSESAEAELDEAAVAGSRFHGDAKAAPRPAGDLAAELAAELVSPLRDKVEASLRDAGGDEDAAADGIRAAYRDWKSKRVVDVARDAVVGAFSRGVYDAAPAGTSMRWVVDDGAAACPDCDDDALAGGIVKGEPFPTGHAHPPAHAGCRCLLVPGEGGVAL
ncbi:MAG: DivIVA domain-containing protein [Acidimicrobiales bacterium]